MVSYIKGTQTEGVRELMLKRIFGRKSDNIIGGFRNLLSEGLHNLSSSPK
jgi:hypothetical protein